VDKVISSEQRKEHTMEQPRSPARVARRRRQPPVVKPSCAQQRPARRSAVEDNAFMDRLAERDEGRQAHEADALLDSSLC